MLEITFPSDKGKRLSKSGEAVSFNVRCKGWIVYEKRRQQKKGKRKPTGRRLPSLFLLASALARRGRGDARGESVRTACSLKSALDS